MPPPTDPIKREAWLNARRGENNCNFGGKCVYEETREKMRASARIRSPRKQTDAEKAKRSATFKKRFENPEIYEKTVSMLRGLSKDPVVLEKISKKAKDRFLDPDYRKRNADRLQIMRADPKFGEAVSKKLKLRWETDPIYREKMSVGSAERWKNNLEYRAMMSKRMIESNPMSGKCGEESTNWRGGVSFGKYCPKFNFKFKERVRAFFGYTCQKCGYVWQPGERRLAVHHVNYRKDSCCNENVKPLFVPVCPGRCHSETGYNRDYWEVFFTKLINEIYEGKCYFTKEEWEMLQ